MTQIAAVSLTGMFISHTSAFASENEIPQKRESRGIGWALCDRFIVWHENQIDLSGVVSWTYGYWSAINLSYSKTGHAKRDLFDETVDPKALITRLAALCYSTPQSPLAPLIAEIFLELPELHEDVETRNLESKP